MRPEPTEEKRMRDEDVGLTLEQRRAVFAAVIAAQDEGLSVWDSREVIARRYAIDVAAVREIEDEGLNGKWPPFGKG
jgi:hypothetical protein